MALLGALVDLVLPRSCVGCGAWAGAWCAGCRPPGTAFPVPGQADVYAAAGYDGAVRAALLAYKERGRRDLAGPLAELLAGAVRACAAGRSPPGRVLLVPVPSARAVAAARGGDHVARLARRAAVVTGMRVAPAVLAFGRAVRDSAGLDEGARAANLTGAFVARPAVPGCCAVVVDDIVTTGSTLREARRALAAAGWPVIGAAAVAATERRFARSATSVWLPLAGSSEGG